MHAGARPWRRIDRFELSPPLGARACTPTGPCATAAATLQKRRRRPPAAVARSSFRDFRDRLRHSRRRWGRARPRGWRRSMGRASIRAAQMRRRRQVHALLRGRRHPAVRIRHILAV